MYGKLAFVAAAFLAVVRVGAEGDSQCWVTPPESVTKLNWPDMKLNCVTEVKSHIKRELEASVTYIAMGAHFLNAANFRPGIAHMALKHANEERQHAKALMEYLLMRGESITKDEIPLLKPVSTNWDNVLQALNTTLSIEKDVRDYFKKIIFTCEGGEDADHSDVDYHISDFLTGNFLEEQHHGVHEISQLMINLGRLIEKSGNAAFAEIEFDRTLVK